MIAARYPEISDPKTTVEFMIDGLKNNPYSAYIGLQLLALNPTDIKDFVHKFNRISSYQSASNTTIPTAHNIPPPTPRRFNRNYNNYNTRPTKPSSSHQKNQEFKPCTFHIQRGVMNPRHTDSECNHPHHPRHNTPQTAQPTTRFAQAPQPFEYEQITTYQPHPEQSEEPDTNQGTSILDSGSDPSHIPFASKQMHKPRTPIITTSATNDKHPCTNTGQVTLTTNKHAPITLPAVTNPAVPVNLISVHDLALRYGDVIFKHDKALIYKSTKNGKSLIGTAPWNSDLRAYSWPYPSPVSRGARCASIPHTPSRDTSIKQHGNSPKESKKSKKYHPNRKPLPHKVKGSFIRISKQLEPENPTDPQTTPEQLSLSKWHLRLNHAPPKAIQSMATNDTITGLPRSLRKPPAKLTCSSCAHGKQRPSRHHPTTHPYHTGEYFSSDTCGPIKPPSRHGNNYFITFLDAASRYLTLYFLKTRKEVGLVIPAFLQLLKTRYKRTPIIFRSDNAGEFQSNQMSFVYSVSGIEYRSNTPHQPQENSVAERINQTLMNAARAALHHARLDDTFWEDAVRDAAYKYKVMAHGNRKTSPYEAWSDIKPCSKHIFVFGQLGTIPVYHDKNRKLQPRSDPARYMYATSPSKIHVYNLRSHRYQQLRSSDFRPYSKSTDSTAQHAISFRTVSTPVPSIFPTPPTSPTPSIRQNHNIPNKPQQTPPKSLKEARSYPDAAAWATAHDRELATLDATNTIKWIPDKMLRKHVRLIPLKMTYKYKTSPDDKSVTYKARCTVRGDYMQAGIDFRMDQVTTYMADKTSIRTLLALTAANKWPAEHFDITSAYLHERYSNDRPVYITQHPLFDGSFKHPCKAGILVGNLYGTPPASFIYFSALSDYLRQHDFHPTPTDPCVFTKTKKQAQTILAVSIDDFYVTATEPCLIDDLFHLLAKKYNIKRLGSPTNYLNWHIVKDNNGNIHISQPHVIDALLHKHGLLNCNTKDTPSPFKINAELEHSSPPLNNDEKKNFQQAVGDLRYLADSTRFDIHYITNRLASHMHKPTDYDLQNLKWLFRYLSGTKTHGIMYHSTTKSSSPLATYSDADYANSANRRSYTGIVHTLHGSPICWSSKKQSVIALSTCEAEYLSASSATQQTNWIRRLLADLSFPQSNPTPHFIDNNAAISIGTNTGPTKRRKYIDICHHYLNDHLAQNLITMKRIPSSSNPADMFTKPLGNTLFNRFTRALNFTSQPQSVSPGTV